MHLPFCSARLQSSCSNLICLVFSLLCSFLLQYYLIITLNSDGFAPLCSLLNHDRFAHYLVCAACSDRLRLLSSSQLRSALYFPPMGVLISFKITHHWDTYNLILSFTIRYKLSRISKDIVAITIMINWFLAANPDHFWRPAKSENMANPDFEHLKHLQNLGHFLLTAICIFNIHTVLFQY